MKDSTTAVQIGTDLLDTMLTPPKLAEPAHACPDCKTPNFYAGPCHDCQQARYRRSDAIRGMERQIPPRYREARFGDPDTLAKRVADPKAIDIAKTALTKHKVVTLFGATGTGKTTLASAIARQWVFDTSKATAFVPAFKLATARAEAGLGSTPDVIERACGAPLLVLDDLGNEPLRADSAIVEVLHARYDADLATVATVAVSKPDLAARYGGGVARRLLEGACVIELKGKR
jgi:DNA replication protein DnaC